MRIRDLVNPGSGMEEIKSGSGISNINWSTLLLHGFFPLIIKKNHFHQFRQYFNHVDEHFGSNWTFFSIAFYGQSIISFIQLGLLDIRKQSIEVLCLCLYTYVNRTSSIISEVRLKAVLLYPPPPPSRNTVLYTKVDKSVEMHDKQNTHTESTRPNHRTLKNFP